MPGALQGILKRQIEKLLGCRIYRGEIRHGTEYFVDIERAIGLGNVRTIFDVGANVGQTSMHYLVRFPHADIHAFEPVSATYAELARTVAGQPRVHPHQSGMGRERGEALINVSPMSTNSSIVQAEPGDTTETIRIDTIADFCAEQRITSIDLLKIDTEGYELEVLMGALPQLKARQIAFIFMECGPIARKEARFVPFQSAADFLLPFGYEPFGIYEQSLYWDGRKSLQFFNALFISPEVIGQPVR